MIVNGTMVFVKNSKAKLAAKGKRNFLFSAAFRARRMVSRKNMVKMVSRFPERALKTNQMADEREMADAKPTKGWKSFFPKRYIKIMLMRPASAEGNLVQNSFTPNSLKVSAISQ